MRGKCVWIAAGSASVLMCGLCGGIANADPMEVVVSDSFAAASLTGLFGNDAETEIRAGFGSSQIGFEADALWGHADLDVTSAAMNQRIDVTGNGFDMSSRVGLGAAFDGLARAGSGGVEVMAGSFTEIDILEAGQYAIGITHGTETETIGGLDDGSGVSIWVSSANEGSLLGVPERLLSAVYGVNAVAWEGRLEAGDVLRFWAYNRLVFSTAEAFGEMLEGEAGGDSAFSMSFAAVPAPGVLALSAGGCVVASRRRR